MMDQIVIYTDGACSGNPGPGGYGIVMKYGKHRKEFSEGYKYTTNNRMELLSVIVALEQIKTNGIPVVIYSDSKYVVDAFEKNWLSGWIKKDFKNVKNVDLWKRLIPLCQKYKPKFVWVKGHSNNEENNRCDELAVAASKKTKLCEDLGYQPV